MSPRPRVCAIVPSGADPSGTLGLLAEPLTERASLSFVVAGDPLPDLDDIDLVVAMGSAHSAFDDSIPWLADQLAFIREAVETKAVLGICFGAQVMSRALGGTVARAGTPEIGWYEVDTADPQLVPPGPWFQHHFDAFTTPPGATEIAHTATCAQSFRVCRSLAIQFHPEISAAALAAWRASRAGSGTSTTTFDAFEPEIIDREPVSRELTKQLVDRVWSDIAGLG